MGPSNKELQLRKNCKLYRYVLYSLGKEIPEAIEDCADSEEYDYLVDCVADLSKEIKNFDSETFDRIVNNSEVPEARELAQWWEMYKMYTPPPS